MEMQDIKPIKTLYKGQLFVSRLKARWAVFFDTLPIKWVYKPVENSWFPDFWLPQVNMWAEVKPLPFTQTELLLGVNLVNSTKYSLLMLIGERPKYRPYYALEAFAQPEHVEVGYYPYALSNCHNYPTEENRFYFCMGDNLEDEGGIDSFGDIVKAVHIAKEYKFEDADS